MKQHRLKQHPFFVPCASIAIAMLLIAGWVISKAIPSSETARLRNALVAHVGSEADFTWRPSAVPSSFHQEKISVETNFSNYMSHRLGSVLVDSELDKSLVVARFLLSHSDRNAEAIMSNSSEAIRLIVEKGTGYCADYTQVFNAAAYLHKIPVREWGISFDGFGGKGHAISEIYDQNLQKWVLIDTFYAFYLVDKTTDVPLSVIQFQRFLQNSSPDKLKDKIKVIKIKPSRFGFLNETKLFQYFARGENHFYLWWGNNALSYDNNPFISLASKFSRYSEQLVAIALGIHQEIRLLPNKKNIRDIDALLKLRTQLLGALFLELFLGLILVLLFLLIICNRKAIHQIQSAMLTKTDR